MPKHYLYSKRDIYSGTFKKNENLNTSYDRNQLHKCTLND